MYRSADYIPGMERSNTRRLRYHLRSWPACVTYVAIIGTGIEQVLAQH